MLTVCFSNLTFKNFKNDKDTDMNSFLRWSTSLRIMSLSQKNASCGYYEFLPQKGDMELTQFLNLLSKAFRRIFWIHIPH